MKENEQHIPSQTDPFGRFVQEHVAHFCICEIVEKTLRSIYSIRHSLGKARHIPPQTDTVVRFAPEHVVLFPLSISASIATGYIEKEVTIVLHP